MLRHMKISALFLLGAALAPIPTGPSAVLIDNSEVRVLRALENNHDLGKFHKHDLNRVMIYLQSSRQHFEYQDGRKPETFDWTAGEVKWSLADGMHAGQVLGHDFNIIEVELKLTGTDKPLADSLDPLKVDPVQFKLEFENPQARVLRIRIKPHAAVPTHAFPTNRVTLFLTDQKFRIKDSAGVTDTVEHKAGDVVWGTPTALTEQNLSDKPFEALVIEVKK
jgi:hypothetical protein